MAPRNELPPQLIGRAFSTSDALRCGVGADRVRHGDLARPIRGIRVDADGPELRTRLEAYVAHRQRDFAFSHATAALLYGIPLPRRLPAEVHVSVPDPGRAPHIRGFVGHKLSRWETRDVEGLPVTTPQQTWLDLADMLDVVELVVAGDYLVSRRRPLTTRSALRAALSASAGRRGVARARSALDEVRDGSESPGETRLRLVLTSAGLPEPELNHQIRDVKGDFVARVDLAYVGARIALEYEGDVHRVDRDVWQRDIRRREQVEDLGWRMVRVTADDVRAPAPLLERTRRLLNIQ